MRVFAYDSDDGNNSLLTYSFIPDPGSNSEEYFRIDNSTGVIYLKKSLAGVCFYADSMVFYSIVDIFRQLIGFSIHV